MTWKKQLGSENKWIRGCNHSLYSRSENHALNPYKPPHKITQITPRNPCCQGFEMRKEKQMKDGSNGQKTSAYSIGHGVI